MHSFSVLLQLDIIVTSRCMWLLAVLSKKVVYEQFFLTIFKSGTNCGWNIEENYLEYE